MLTDRLTLAFSALSDPTRRAILERLKLREAPVTELAMPFDMSLPAISRHLKVLGQAGLITRRYESQRRPCKLNARPLRAVADWIEKYRPHWEGDQDLLGGYLKDLQSTTARTRKQTKVKAKTKTKAKRPVRKAR